MTVRDHNAKEERSVSTGRAAEASEMRSGPVSSAADLADKIRFAPGLLSPREMLRLGGTVGNRAVRQLLARPAGVVRQRQTAEEEEEPLQAKAAPSPVSSPGSSGGGASPLPSSLRQGLEGLSGFDLSGVRVHADDPAPGRVNALAYAEGENIRLAPGQEQHLAHEGWHVVQQMQGRVRATASEGGAAINDDASLEREADEMGEEARRWSGAGSLQRKTFSGISPHQTTLSPIQRVDQHAGAVIPTATTQSRIHGELYPARGAAGAPPLPWDGQITNFFDPSAIYQAATNRVQLVTAMHNAMRTYLAAAMPGIRATAARRRVSIASLEGAGQAAKADVDAQFGSYATAAALTAAQETARAAYAITASGPGQNLFDAQNPVDRATVGMGIDPVDLANWMSETVPGCVAARNLHHLDPTRSTEERNFLRSQIVAPFAATHNADLRLFDLHGFALSNPATGQIVLPTSVRGGLSDVAPRAGVPSPAELAVKWAGWRTMVHEYIHQLEHPALRAWPGRNRTLYEGFCEYFTKKVLFPLLPRRAGRDVTRRTLVEGGNYGAPSATIIGGGYNAGSYAGYLQHVENIERHLGGRAIGAQNAMKAIFFQGHLEYLGYDTSGAALTAAPGLQNEITVPASLTTYAALAAALNVSARRLRRANPGKTEPLSGRLHAPGCREHRVVIAGRRGSGLAGESLADIATQHGVSQAALQRANPGVNFATLGEGSVVIIPRH
jgi:hypothetical protein